MYTIYTWGASNLFLPDTGTLTCSWLSCEFPRVARITANCRAALSHSAYPQSTNATAAEIT